MTTPELVTVAIAGAGALVSVGRNVAALKSLERAVDKYAGNQERSERETRETLQRFGERIGALETRGAVEREFSGRVRPHG